MLIHDQVANHQHSWDGPVTIRLAKSAPTSVSNPLVALDILKHHWSDQEQTADYQQAVEACLQAIQGRGDLKNARDAFIRATQHLSTIDTLQDLPLEQPAVRSSGLNQSRPIG
jgi:hypothetical protein